MSYYLNAAHHLAELLATREDKNRVVLVNKSTVPVGTARLLENIMAEHGVENFGVASNPEFLAQGNAIVGSRRPDRVVIGADTQMIWKSFAAFIRNLSIMCASAI